VDAYRTALIDWLACATAGRDEPAAQAAATASDGLTGAVAAAGAAGHVLDFDDTYAPGLSHLSAAVAPAAVLAGASVGAGVGDVLSAYAAGFEAMGAVARASHPALYDRGWHPTALCGPIGAATAAADLLGVDRATAVGLALLRSGGVRAAFGSDGKSLQVGMAAAAGVEGARLAAGGADVPGDIAAAADGWCQATGATWAAPDPAAPAVAENWIKAYPCCLQTHAAIDAALELRERGWSAPAAHALTVHVHPVSRQAAAYDGVRTPLQAKFSIPYCTALALLRGRPRRASFTSLDDEVAALAAQIAVTTDSSLATTETLLVGPDGSELARVAVARGAPSRPLSEDELAAKVADLAGTRLAGALEDEATPIAAVARAAGLPVS
jgi:2-methylcitrate dehydratase PrpD